MSIWRTLTYPFRPGPRRPLAERRPEMQRARDTELGMEATDLSLVNRVSRHNDALERTTSSAYTTRQSGFITGNAATDIDPMPEDETYAAQYHRAFQKKGPKT